MLNQATLQRSKKVVKHALLRGFAAARKVGREGGNRVLLTFDDGPHAEFTEGVLHRLSRYGARAVFFVVGDRIPAAPQVLPRILAGGHLLGNHTFSHLAREPWPVAYAKDVVRCQRAVEALTGQRPRLFRPPLGRVSLTSLVVPRLLGLNCVYWSVDSDDWRLRSQADARACAERLKGLVGAGDILLLHDDHPYVLPVLDVLLPWLSSRGYDLGGAVRFL
jgi:peptidoglycan/xylan/chitin deacetylase (PgdA/CDA1 family)